MGAPLKTLRHLNHTHGNDCISCLAHNDPDFLALTLENNRDYLINYDEREKANKPFTSQVAESHIDSIINARHKRKQKMQWTREGAHNVLQIRALMASDEWEEKWLEYVMPGLEKTA